MPDTAITNEQRIRSLERHGYTRREAEFLCIAALHSGFFLRRQYVAFTEKAVGGTAATLVEKLIAKSHSRVTTCAGATHIYHLCARPFYAAIGEENNRNRRMHQPASIKSKLMALDFVLAHPEGHYLTTEPEKMEYFKGKLGLDSVVLPSVQYAIRDKVSERYFVEKFPIFLATSPSAEEKEIPSFCFVDPGAVGLAGFETFLRKYTPFLSVLNDFDLIYVAATEMHFDAAARAFERHFRLRENAPNLAADNELGTSLVRYFSARRLVESRQWDTFDRAKAVQYRKDKERFEGSKYDAFYDHWLTRGDAAISAVLSPKQAIQRVVTGRFSTFLLNEDYELFSSVAA